MTTSLMDTFAPLFSKIVDSSLWSEPDHICKIFITMLALKDADHVVRCSAFALAQRAHKTEQEVLEALQVLSSPDTTRLEPQPYEGRRIQKVEDGWLVLNGEYYRTLMRQISSRWYQRTYKAKRRHKNQPQASERLETQAL